MGLFDKLGGNKELSLTPMAGMLLSAITMEAMDGDPNDDDFAAIRRLDFRRRRDAWDSALEAWKTKSLGECVLLAEVSMNREQRIVAIANLIDIAMAAMGDGTIAGPEQSLLELYVEAFEVEEEIIKQIIDVISIKNNTDIFY